MAGKSKTKSVCFLCGQASKVGPELCAVNLHDFVELRPSESQNGYLGFFQKGAAHVGCLTPYLTEADAKEGNCSVCRKSIDPAQRAAFKLAIYIYRKPGCSSVIAMHEDCLRSIKSEKFSLIRVNLL